MCPRAGIWLILKHTQGPRFTLQPWGLGGAVLSDTLMHVYSPNTQGVEVAGLQITGQSGLSSCRAA